MKYRLPCQHEGGTGEYYSLTRDEISNLLMIAATSTKGDPVRSDIQCRLAQGIRGVRCPYELGGAAAQKMNELNNLYVETLLNHPEELPTMVERFYQIMQGEGIAK